MPSPCSSPPWNCLELTQPIGRRGRSRRWTSLHESQTKISRNLLPVRLPHLAAHQQDSRTLIAGRIGAANPLPPQIRTGIPRHALPLSPAAVESEPRNTEAAAAAPRTGTGEKENRDLFLPPQLLRRKQRVGCGRIGVGSLGLGSKPNLAAGNRETSSLGRSPSLLSLGVSDGLLLWSLFCLVFGKHLVSWSISLLFGFFPLSLSLSLPTFISENYVGFVKRKGSGRNKYFLRESKGSIVYKLHIYIVSSIKDF